MNRSRKLLLVSGLALVLWGMSFGLYYALFVEHQTLDQIGGSMAMSFADAAEGRSAESDASLDRYSAAQHNYVRSVDVHSHWIGLAMLLIVFGVVFDRVGRNERYRFMLALALVVGSATFPLAVLLQTVSSGPAFRVIAAIAAGVITVALMGVAIGLAQSKLTVFDPRKDP